MKTLSDFVTEKTIPENIITPDSLVTEAISLMENKNINYLVVMTECNYLGLITENDCFSKIILLGRNGATTRVKEVMRTDLPVISINEDINECMDIMSVFRIRHIPVFEEFRFIAVISMEELYKDLILGEKETVQKQKKEVQYSKASLESGNSQHCCI